MKNMPTDLLKLIIEPFDLNIYSETLFNIKQNYKVTELDNDCKNFVERNKNKKFKDYITDGVRFCYKVYSVTQASIVIMIY